MANFIGNFRGNTIIPGFVSFGVIRFPFFSTPSNANDFIDGRGGNDRLDGGGGDDVILGGFGNDDITGGLGSDTVSGGFGNDVIRLGQDSVFNGDRMVLLDVGMTHTVALTGASGTSDSVNGGFGFDTLVLNAPIGGFIADYYNAPGLLSGVERIIGTSGNDLITLPSVYPSALGGAVEIVGGAGNDVLVGSDTTSDTIYGDGGDDVVAGRGSNDVLAGGTGTDEVWGGLGDDTILLGPDGFFTGIRNVTVAPFDTRAISLTNAAGTGDTVNGGLGYDTIELDAGLGFIADYQSAPALLNGVEAIVGTNGDDLIALPLFYLTAQGGAVQIEGAAGDDVLVGSNSTEDTILGGADNDLLAGLAGDDTLEGGAGNDELIGGFGNDVLRGGLGQDILSGRLGSDVFDYNSVLESAPLNSDLITNFDQVGGPLGGDRIDVSDIDAQLFTPGKQDFSFTGTSNGGAGSLWVANNGFNSVIFGDIGGTLAPELAIVVADGVFTTASNWTTDEFILT
jgi:Ca2+-binding RTX toxin-like protein